MTRKTFAMVMVAGLIGLAALAVGLRPTSGPANSAAKEAAGGPSVETTVVQRTEVVRRHRATESSTQPEANDYVVVPRTYADYVQPASAPRPTTSPSGSGDDDHGEERSDHDDDHEERDDHGSDHEQEHHDDGRDD